jgi:two-component system, LytTR family, sensor kinase
MILPGRTARNTRTEPITGMADEIAERENAGSLRVRWWPAFLVASTLVVLFTMQNLVAPPARLAAQTPGNLLLMQAATWYTWLPLLPLIVRTVRAARHDGKLRAIRLPLQLLSAAYITLLHGALAGVARWLTGVSSSPDLLVALVNFPIYDFASGFTHYCLVSAFYHVAAYHEEVRIREVAGARLAASLAQARLENLQRVLQPHFLFNTLNSVAELVREDPQKAEQMVENLAELLRASLTVGKSNEIPLEEELGLLEMYAAIERVRFQQRLRIEMDVPTSVRSARVPQLLLQPLVENAIRHGISRREGPGLVTVTAQRLNRSLRIQVIDDGVGPGETGVRTGIGLGATRERLQQLYGRDQQLVIAAGVPSGTVVTVDLPWRSETDT